MNIHDTCSDAEMTSRCPAANDKTDRELKDTFCDVLVSAGVLEPPAEE